jgi:hypothetical protein
VVQSAPELAAAQLAAQGEHKGHSPRRKEHQS